MHVLGHYGKENAAAIFELFLECMPEYPLDKPDNEGNTGAPAGGCCSSRSRATCSLDGVDLEPSGVFFQFCFWPT